MTFRAHQPGSKVPPLDYDRHLFQERQVRSVTANTRADGEEFLGLAARMGLRVSTTTYPLDRADEALRDLAGDRVTGAAVLVPGARAGRLRARRAAKRGSGA